MPRDGSGVFSAPAGTTATPNTTIESAKYNALVADLVADANAARPLTAGGTAATTAVGAADAMSPDFASVASATTCDIGAASSPNVNITGTTTITSFGTKTAGAKRFVKFAGALTLTHNGTSLILPGAANITTAANDTAIFVSEGSGNWRCLAYHRASTVPVRTQAWELISTQTASSSASLNFTDLSAYRTLRFTGLLYPATDEVGLSLRVSTDNGSTYESTAAYQTQSVRGQGTTTASAVATTGATAIQLSPAGDIGNAANEAIQFDFMIHNFNATGVYPFVVGTAYQIDHLGGQFTGSVGGRWQGSTARNAFQVFMSSGNIASGYVTLEGIRG